MVESMLDIFGLTLKGFAAFCTDEVEYLGFVWWVMG